MFAIIPKCKLDKLPAKFRIKIVEDRGENCVVRVIIWSIKKTGKTMSKSEDVISP